MHPARKLRLAVVSALVLVLLAAVAHAQAPQLSLADILIGLRSKKASLPERNAILAEAVRARGVTFSTTPEIEKELAATGASPALLDAIRQKSVKPVPAPVIPKPTPIPTPTPTPPDFNFFQSRADQSSVRGEYLLAVSDYSRSIELKADNPVAYLNRGRAHYNLKSYDLSLKDFEKAVELNPKDSSAYFNRAVAHEQLGDVNKAMADYQKAVDLDPNNVSATASLKQLRDAETARLAAEAAKNTPPPPPEFVNLGYLTAAHAARMVTPVYSQVAMRANVEGRVVVEIELNESGDVVSAKATLGHQMLRGSAEEAARRSKFKPGTYNNKPIKAKAAIIYNFTLRQAR